ncbi:MAG: ribonuclease III [Balneolaceae bacterium]|nr:MAG: ribonuclease III [Balneolaceae bacterium]
MLERKQLDSVQKKKVKAISAMTGLPVCRPALYLKALRHRSLVAERNLAATESYEQLEFMGDAVLDLIVSEIIYKKFPEAGEGLLTQLRSRLVKGEMLAQIGRNIRLMDYIELGDRVKNQGVEHSESVLADAFEALVGAVYEDHGYEKCRDFVARLYRRYVDFDEMISARDNYKSMLLEAAQAKKMPAPVYRIVGESGPGHEKTFDVEVRVNDRVLGAGSGKNKKKAEQAAAQEALNILRNM